MEYIPYFGSVLISGFDTCSSSKQSSTQDVLLEPDLCGLSGPFDLPVDFQLRLFS
jgi:hypothetical protein